MKMYLSKLTEVLGETNLCFEKDYSLLNCDLPETVLQAAKKEGNARKVYRRTLEAYLPLEEVTLSATPRILSIGCGWAIDAFVQKGYIGGNGWGSDINNISYFGVDINADSIRVAREKHMTSLLLRSPTIRS